MKKPEKPVLQNRTVSSSPKKIVIGAFLCLLIPILSGGITTLIETQPISAWLSHAQAQMALGAMAAALFAALFRKIPFVAFLLLCGSAVCSLFYMDPDALNYLFAILALQNEMFLSLASSLSMDPEVFLTSLLVGGTGLGVLACLLGTLTPKLIGLARFLEILLVAILFGGTAYLLYENLRGGPIDFSIEFVYLMGAVLSPGLFQIALAFYAGGIGNSAKREPKTAEIPQTGKGGFQPQGVGHGNPARMNSNEKGFSMADFRQQGGANNPPYNPNVPPQMMPQGYPQGYPQGIPQGYVQAPPPGYQGGYFMPAQQSYPNMAPQNPYAPVPPNGTKAIASAKNPPSRFTGSPFKLVGIELASFLITLLSAFLALPSAVCMHAKWIADHSYIDGRRIRFEGEPKELYKKWFLWLFLILPTAGIFLFVIPAKVRNWVANNTHIVQ